MDSCTQHAWRQPPPTPTLPPPGPSTKPAYSAWDGRHSPLCLWLQSDTSAAHPDTSTCRQPKHQPRQGRAPCAGIMTPLEPLTCGQPSPKHRRRLHACRALPKPATAVQQLAAFSQLGSGASIHTQQDCANPLLPAHPLCVVRQRRHRKTELQTQVCKSWSKQKDITRSQTCNQLHRLTSQPPCSANPLVHATCLSRHSILYADSCPSRGCKQ